MLLLSLLACAPADTVVYSAAQLDGDLEGYEDWAHPDGWDGIVPSCATSHGDYVEIWMNAVASADLAAGTTPLSDGAILVNQSYQDAGGTTPKLLTAMRKTTGFDPDGADWFWGQYDEDGALVDSGKIAACSSCHMMGMDFVRHVDETPVTSPEDCPTD
jgi:hypothetical protein